MKQLAGINGFGRFGLHLLRYWLERNQSAHYQLAFINDDTLTLDQVFHMIHHDPYVSFRGYKVIKEGSTLVLLERDGTRHELQYTQIESHQIPWIGSPSLFLECSGKNTARSRCVQFLQGKTKQVLISATSWDADKTIVFGFNHTEYDPKRHPVISYGSCTVNGY